MSAVERILLQARQIRKQYVLGGREIEVLHGIDITVKKGDFVSIMGTSGSGKSTLLHILGSLIKPERGTYHLNGKNMLAIDDNEQSWVRAHWIGFVFQTFDLLHELDVVGNVSLPFQYNTARAGDARKRVLEAVDQVGLTHRKTHRPMELSGGEMQRVAIARALAIQPKLILADEPTGNLDNTSSNEILSLFAKLNEKGTTIIMVTHDPLVASVSRQTFMMEDGYLVPAHV
jgi:putative ABC transport system ATP-binding protein